MTLNNAKMIFIEINSAGMIFLSIVYFKAVSRDFIYFSVVNDTRARFFGVKQYCNEIFWC